jgi:hypothetical protein
MLRDDKLQCYLYENERSSLAAEQKLFYYMVYDGGKTGASLLPRARCPCVTSKQVLGTGLWTLGALFCLLALKSV